MPDRLSEVLSTVDVLLAVVEPYLRLMKVEELWGGASKADRQVGWEPRAQFTERAGIMREHDLRETGVEPALSVRVCG